MVISLSLSDPPFRQRRARRMGAPATGAPRAGEPGQYRSALGFLRRRGTVGGRRARYLVHLRFGSLGLAPCGSLLFHLLHPFDHALVGAWEDRFHLAELGSNLQLTPRQFRQPAICCDVPQPELPPDFVRRLGDNGMRQRGDDSQRLGGGVQNRCQLRTRIRVLLLGQRPRMRLGDVAAQPPR